MKAIEILTEPDPDSRDGGDGRRIERVEGGFHILGYGRVMADGIGEERREYLRTKQQESRARRKSVTLRAPGTAPLKKGLAYPAAPKEAGE